MAEQNHITNKPLPIEVTSKILNMLTFQEKLNARRVCNYWRIILDEFGNYKFCLTVEDNTLVDFLLNCSFPFLEFLHLRGVTKAMSSTFSRNKFPRVRTAVLGNQNSGPTILRFLKYGLVSAEELTIEDYAFKNVVTSQISSVLGEVNFQNLSQFELKITTTPDTMKLAKKQVTQISCFLEFVNMPHLKDLKIHMNCDTNLEEDEALIQNIGPEFYKFIARHSKTLKGLSWSFHISEYEVPDSHSLFVLSIPNEIMDSIRSNLKLNTFEVRWCYNIFPLVLPSLCGSDSLISITVRMNGVSSLAPGFAEPISNVLQRNKATLTDVAMHVNTELDMSLLRNCHKLRSLSIYVNNSETRMVNPSINGINFPELKSFKLTSWGIEFPENFSFDSWIVERMPMMEKIQLKTYDRLLWIPALQTLVNGLNRLKEIRIDVDKINDHMVDKLDIYCAETEGLTFTRIPDIHRGQTLSYLIKIDR